jgi:hypothetical protein
MTIELYAQAESGADRAAAHQIGEMFMTNPRDGREDELNGGSGGARVASC